MHWEVIGIEASKLGYQIIYRLESHAEIFTFFQRSKTEILKDFERRDWHESVLEKIMLTTL